MIKILNINTEQAFSGKLISTSPANNRARHAFAFRVLAVFAFAFVVAALISPSGVAHATYNSVIQGTSSSAVLEVEGGLDCGLNGAPIEGISGEYCACNPGWTGAICNVQEPGGGGGGGGGIPPTETVPYAPSLTLEERTSTSISLKWLDISSVEDGYELQRENASDGTWDTLASWGSWDGEISWSDSPLTPDTRYCYRVRVYNNLGENFSPNENFSLKRCVYTRDGNSNTVWRAQIIFRTADVEHAGTNDDVLVALNEGHPVVAAPRGNSTWVDYGRNDFESGDEFAYDLDLHGVGELGDITQIHIAKTGNDGWCIVDFTLNINGQDVYSENFSATPSGCQWLDNEDGHSRHYTVSHATLRAHTAWSNYNHALALFDLSLLGFPNEEIVSRIEGMVGDFIHGKKLYWGHLDGPAVEVSKGCPVGEENCQTVHVNLDLAAAASIEFAFDLPDPAVDVDFDLNFACTNGQLSIQSTNVEVVADSDWFWEVLSVGLINFVDSEVEDRVQQGWQNITETFEVSDCNVHVDDDGDVIVEEGTSPLLVNPPLFGGQELAEDNTETEPPFSGLLYDYNSKSAEPDSGSDPATKKTYLERSDEGRKASSVGR